MGINPNPRIENSLFSLPLHVLDPQVERIENSCYFIRRMLQLVNYELPYNDCQGAKFIIRLIIYTSFVQV